MSRNNSYFCCDNDNNYKADDIQDYQVCRIEWHDVMKLQIGVSYHESYHNQALDLLVDKVSHALFPFNNNEMTSPTSAAIMPAMRTDSMLWNMLIPM